MEPQDIRDILNNALQFKMAEAVISGENFNIARVQVAQAVVRKITDDAIEAILVQLFTEATANQGL